MFYATAIPDKLQPGELDNMRVIGVAETIPMLRDKTKSDIKKFHLADGMFTRIFIYWQ